jgi:hypothetical protein
MCLITFDIKFSFKSGWCRFKKSSWERGGRGGGFLKFNTYLRREGCWEITHIDARGSGVSKKAPKFNTYYLNGPKASFRI